MLYCVQSYVKCLKAMLMLLLQFSPLIIEYDHPPSSICSFFVFRFFSQQHEKLSARRRRRSKKKERKEKHCKCDPAACCCNILKSSHCYCCVLSLQKEKWEMCTASNVRETEKEKGMKCSIWKRKKKSSGNRIMMGSIQANLSQFFNV